MRDDVFVLRRVYQEIVTFLAKYAAHRDDFTAAALAFYVALALAPAALAFGALVSMVLPSAQVQSSLTELAANIPPSAAILRPIVDSAISITEHSSSASFTITTVIGTLVAVYAASRFIYTLRIGLDIVHGTAEKNQGFVTRLFSALITLVLLCIGAAALIVFVVLPKVLSNFGIDLAFLTDITVLDWAVSFLILYVVIRLLYRFGPHQHANVGWLSIGAAFATVWVIVVSIGIGYYAAWSTSLDAAVALLGAGIGFMFWLYVVFIGFFIGAELQESVNEGLFRRIRG